MFSFLEIHGKSIPSLPASASQDKLWGVLIQIFEIWQVWWPRQAPRVLNRPEFLYLLGPNSLRCPADSYGHYRLKAKFVNISDTSISWSTLKVVKIDKFMYKFIDKMAILL